MRAIRDLKGTVYRLNKPLIDFEIERGQTTTLDFLDTENLPYEFIQKNKYTALLAFLDDRVCPDTRIGLQKDLERVGISYFSLDEILKYSNGYSVQDYYWIRFGDGVQSWEELVHHKYDGLKACENFKNKLLSLTL